MWGLGGCIYEGCYFCEAFVYDTMILDEFTTYINGKNGKYTKHIEVYMLVLVPTCSQARDPVSLPESICSQLDHSSQEISQPLSQILEVSGKSINTPTTLITSLRHFRPEKSILYELAFLGSNHPPELYGLYNMHKSDPFSHISTGNTTASLCWRRSLPVRVQSGLLGLT